MSGISNSARKDDTADASQFLSRLGYVVFGLAAPASVVLHPLAIFVLFPIGVVLIVFSALLDPPMGVARRLRAGLASPIVALGLGGLAWATLSISWTPFSVAAGQHALKMFLWSIAVWLSLTLTREHAKATDLYVFPIGLALEMAVILVAGIATRHGAPIEFARILDGGTVLVALVFPAMGGLAARGRNGLARLLLILAFVYTFAIGSTPTMVALFVGFTALSFALSDLDRTTEDLAWISAGLIALAPLVILVLEPAARWTMHARLPTLPAPFPSIAMTSDIVRHDALRLVIGHGFEAVDRGVKTGILPAYTPRALLFQIWYELGIVGALIAAAGAWFGFRAIGDAAPRLAPYLGAAFACNLTLAMLSHDLGDMTWVTALGIALIASDVAARSQYRTTRPSASHLAHF
jgi:hypothetical protein